MPFEPARRAGSRKRRLAPFALSCLVLCSSMLPAVGARGELGPGARPRLVDAPPTPVRRARAPGVAWSFHAGAPLAGPPGLGPDGTVVLATEDGYVHALRADGTFRDSYTVRGRAVGGPVVLPDGTALVPASTDRLYAIDGRGSLRWVKRIGGGVRSPLRLDETGRAWFITGAGTALAVSARGGVLGFAKIGGAMALGPVPVGAETVAVADPRGTLGLIGPHGSYATRALGGAVRWVGAGEAGLLALLGAELVAFDPSGERRFSRPGVERVLCATPLVTLERGAAHWLGPDGVERSQAVLSLERGAVAGCAGGRLITADRQSAVAFAPNGERAPLGVLEGDALAVQAGHDGVLVSERHGRVTLFRLPP